jgi:hypothetical protein
MRAAFDVGRALAKQPNLWSTVPPNVGDILIWALEAIKTVIDLEEIDNRWRIDEKRRVRNAALVRRY